MCCVFNFITNTLDRKLQYIKLVEHTKESLITLYSIAYRYQIRIILQYCRGRAEQSFRNAIRADDWKTMLQEVREQDQKITLSINTLATGDTKERLTKIGVDVNTLAQDINEWAQEMMDNGTDVLEAIKVRWIRFGSGCG